MDVPPAFVDVLASYVRRSRRNPKQLAELTELPLETIKNWLEGRVRRPREWRDIVKLAYALHLSEVEASHLLQAARHPSIRELALAAQYEADRQLLAAYSSAGLATPPAHHAQAPDSPWPLDHVPQRAALPAGSRMPLRPSALFVGRGVELQALAHSFAADRSEHVTAICGLGGIGKTQLALEFVHRYGRLFPGGVFWLNFSDPERIAYEVAACGDGEHLALQPSFDTLSIVEQVRLVRAAWRSPLPRLLVFDNCESESVLADWLPASGGCRVLVTGRRSTWSTALGVQVHAPNVLPRADSVTLLRNYRPDLAPGDVTLQTVAAELGDLPLALHVAGSYLARYRYAVPLQEYLGRLGKLALDDGTAGADTTDEHAAPLARSLTLSFDRLNAADAVDTLALAVLAHAACLAPGEPIPRELLQRTLAEPALAVEDALARLATLGLVSAHGDGAIRFHRLVLGFVRQRVPDQGVRHAVEQGVLGLAQALNEASDVAQIRVLQTHLRVVTDAALPRRDEHAAALSGALGHHYWLLANYRLAPQYLSQARSIRENDLPHDPARLAEVYNLLGLALHLNSRFDDARELFERAIPLWEAALGPEHPSTVDDVNNLGYVLLLQGRYQSAEALLRRTLDARRRYYGLCHHQTARSLHNLGYLCYQQGRYRAAWRYMLLALRIREQALPSPHMATALTVGLLGAIRLAQGDLEQAEGYLCRAIALWRELFGEAHIGLGEAYCYFAIVLDEQGKHNEAQAYLDRALAINLRTFDGQARDTGFIYFTKGRLARRFRRYDEARTHLEQALEIYRHVLGAEHPYTASALDELGLLHLDRHDEPTAERLLGDAIEIRRRALGEAHPDYVRSLRHIGLLHKCQGDAHSAQRVFGQALATSERVLGPRHQLSVRLRGDLRGLVRRAHEAMAEVAPG